LFVLLVLAPFALTSQSVHADRQLPANQPDMGMLYDGLDVATSGPCKGALHVKAVSAAQHCTHGPEVAPAKMNLKSSPSPVSSAPQTAAAAATTVTCDGNGVTGKRVQTIYAHPAGTADQYAAYKLSFEQGAAEVDSDYNISAAQTGSNRHVRFVHDASCTPNIIDVTLSDMQAHPASSDPTPTQLTSGDLTLMLTLFSGITLLALYAVQLIVGGLRETVNA
jgi:hypothetical protein